MMKVGVVGAAGFMGGVLVRQISIHPRLELAMVCGSGSAGRKLRDVRPSLDLDIEIQPADPDLLAAACDVVFLALPHGDSTRLAKPLYERGVTVIDLGADFRLRDPEAIRKWHEIEPPDADILSKAVLVQPELLPAKPGLKLVACPGCFATGLMLGLAALAPHSKSVSCFGVTGSSGSGIAATPRVHHSFRNTNFTAYKALVHQHQGEVKQLLEDIGRPVDFDIVAHSAPMVRGIHLTLIADAPVSKVGEELRRLYDDKKAITLVEGPVPMGAVIGSCRALIGFEGREDKSVVYIAIDNLMKGGSGQAIQILNQVAGWPDTEGLMLHGMWP